MGLSKEQKKGARDLVKAVEARHKAEIELQKHQKFLEDARKKEKEATDLFYSLIPKDEQTRDKPIILGNRVITFRDDAGAITITKGEVVDE